MDIIEEQKLAGATVIMVTHQMDEVERLCDRVILLKDRTSLACGWAGGRRATRNRPCGT